jgi:hypothetical protein
MGIGAVAILRVFAKDYAFVLCMVSFDYGRGNGFAVVPIKVL